MLQKEGKLRGVCEYCKATGLLFRCRYCGGWFCAEHHLPPNHNCPNLELWKSKMPPGVTIRYEGLRPMVYESVDVPAASEPRALAASERTSYNPQLDMVKPYNREWRKVPVEAGERERKPAAALEHCTDKSWISPFLFLIFVALFGGSLIALYSAPDKYAPPLLFILIVSMVGAIASLLSMITRKSS